MAVEPEVVDRWLAVYAETGIKSEACRAVGVSREWARHKAHTDPAFRARMLDAAEVLPIKVSSTVVDGLLNGFRHQVLDRAGDVVTLRKHCPQMMLAYLRRHCGWGEDAVVEAPPVKEITLVDPSGTPVPLLELLRCGVEQDRGIKIKPLKRVTG